MVVWGPGEEGPLQGLSFLLYGTGFSVSCEVKFNSDRLALPNGSAHSFKNRVFMILQTVCTIHHVHNLPLSCWKEHSLGHTKDSHSVAVNTEPTNYCIEKTSDHKT